MPLLRRVVVLRPSLIRCISALSRNSLMTSKGHCEAVPSTWASLLKPQPSRVLYGQTRAFCEDRAGTSFDVQDYDDFHQRVLSSEVPVIVDFHADWCGPCKMLGPRLESIVDSREGRVLLAKVDVDDNSELAMDYDVQAVPTVLAVRNGEIVDKFTGLQDDDAIERMLDSLLVE